MTTINDLVLPVDEPARIGQGFNSQFSHRVIEEGGTKADESYSLDFVLEEGSNIYAARTGTVRRLDISSDFNYFPNPGEDADPELVKKAVENANYMIIEHDDGTYGLYVHLKQNGTLVEEGQRVEQGQKIGLSGNTGYSSEPHLHFSVFRANIDGYKTKTLPISFKNYNGPLEDREINPSLYQGKESTTPAP
jgi:murein DD-endopeptidase MepM/ murein hydrolase activator NlpD